MFSDNQPIKGQNISQLLNSLVECIGTEMEIWFSSLLLSPQNLTSKKYASKVAIVNLSSIGVQPNPLNLDTE